MTLPKLVHDPSGGRDSQVKTHCVCLYKDVSMHQTTLFTQIHGRWKEGAGVGQAPLDFENFSKKGCFLSFR